MDSFFENLPEIVSHLTKRANIMLDSDSFGYSDSLDPDLYSTDEKASDLAGKILVLRGIQRVAYLAELKLPIYL